MNKEKINLEKLKEDHFQTKVPENIDDFIKSGIIKADKEVKKKRNKKIISLVASFVLISFFISIRINSDFANALKDIPYIGELVKLINNDKSLQKAVENDYIQHIGKSQTFDGLKIEVEDIIVDETRMFLFYSIAADSGYKYVNLYNPELLDASGKDLKISSSMSYFIKPNLNESKILRNKIEYIFPDDIKIPEKFVFKTQIATKEREKEEEPQLLENTWEIDFLIDLDKCNNLKEEIKVNKEISVYNQKFEISEITIYPTRLKIKVNFDKNNSMEIFDLINLRLIDENNEEFASIKNGISASGDNESGVVYYLDSSYFYKPKKLRLKFDGIRALEKEDLKVEVDLINKKIVNNNCDNFKFNKISKTEDGLQISFIVFQDDKDDMMYGIFSHDFKDSRGNKYDVDYSGSSSNQNKNYYIQTLNIKEDDFVGNLIFNITSFPNYKYKDIDIKIK